MTPQRAFTLVLITFMIGLRTAPMIHAQQSGEGTECVDVLSFNGGALHTIVNVKTGSARSFIQAETPSDPLAVPVPDWLPLEIPPLSPLTVTDSPHGDYLVAFYPYSDFAVDFHVYRTGDHAEVFQASVEFMDSSSAGRYAWIDDQRLMISEVTPELMDNAVLIDLSNGTSRLIHEDVAAWALSPDGRWLAVQPRLNLSSGDETGLYLYDLSADTNRLISVPFGLRDFVWLTSEEMIGIDYDANVAVYTLTTGTWQTIATVNGNALTLHRSPCQVPEMEAQQCVRLGFASEAARWYFELADGMRIPAQMPPEPVTSVQEAGSYRLVQTHETAETNEYALRLENTVSGERILIDDAVSDLMTPTLSLSPDGTSVAVAFDTPDTRVQVFNDDLVLIADFEVQPDESALLWSPSGHFLAVTTFGPSLDTVTLFEQGVGTAALQTGAQNRRRITWSPDESYLVVYGTYSDFSAEMSLFTTRGGTDILATFIVDSADDAGNAIYGWLDDHTLIVQSNGALSSLDLRSATVQPQSLTGAAVVQEPCTADS